MPLSYTDSEKFLRGEDSVILRQSRRIWPPNQRFLPLTAQILRCAQDDNQSARINHHPYYRVAPTNLFVGVALDEMRRGEGVPPLRREAILASLRWGAIRCCPAGAV